MHNLDLDAPDVVLAAVRNYHGEAGAMVAHVANTDMDVRGRGDSPLDQALIAKLGWIKSTFSTALAASGRGAEATLRDATHTVGALSAGDAAGGRDVNRSAESI